MGKEFENLNLTLYPLLHQASTLPINWPQDWVFVHERKVSSLLVCNIGVNLNTVRMWREASETLDDDEDEADEEHLMIL